MSELAELHVLPHEQSGAWQVGYAPESPALSWHDTADAAAVEARRRAESQGGCRIFLHDRYRRVRTLPLRRPRSAR